MKQFKKSTGELAMQNAIEPMALKVEELLIAKAYEDWSDFIEEDGITIDAEEVISTIFDIVAGNFSENQREELLNLLLAHPTIESTIVEMEQIIKEAAEDHKTYQASPLRYYGMSQKDFL